MTAPHWAPTLAESLTQGDLIRDAWVGAQFHPRAALKGGPTGHGGLRTWHQHPTWHPNGDGFGHYLARGRVAFAVIISYSCEIDKPGAPVLIAPVVSLSTVSAEETKAKIIAGEKYSSFAIPELASVIESSYVDLRAITYVPRAVVDQSQRCASATDHGMQRLMAHLIGFFTRVPMSAFQATNASVAGGVTVVTETKATR